MLPFAFCPLPIAYCLSPIPYCLQLHTYWLNSRYKVHGQLGGFRQKKAPIKSLSQLICVHHCRLSLLHIACYIAYCILPTAYCLLSIAYCPLPIAY